MMMTDECDRLPAQLFERFLMAQLQNHVNEVIVFERIVVAHDVMVLNTSVYIYLFGHLLSVVTRCEAVLWYNLPLAYEKSAGCHILNFSRYTGFCLSFPVHYQLQRKCGHANRPAYLDAQRFTSFHQRVSWKG